MYTDYLEKEGHTQEPEKKLLEEFGIIGVGEDKDRYIRQFTEDMKLGDIVVVRRGGKAIALVEVIGEVSEKKKDKDAKKRLDWFKYRREIRVLEYVKDMPLFPQRQGMLQKSIDTNTKTYKYIDDWYRKLYAIKEIFIDEYKMFNELIISFKNKTSILPIIIIAGINGSGKTSLLEYIKEEFQNQSIYFPAGIGNIENVADEFVKTFYSLLKNEDYRPSEVKEHLDKFMKDIFDGLDLTFSYSHLDKEDNVWFRNNEGKEFKVDELSTGEKTLLSKILYIYFKGYKNKVILIDEPELSLHPSWQNKILSVYEKLAKQNDCQIIIATHSPHIIGSAKSEYIRLLVKEDNKIKVVDNFTNTYGLKFSQILTEVMGVEHLRPVEVDTQLFKVKSMIVQNEYDSDEFKNEWAELEELLGEDYLELKLLKVEIASRRKNVSSN